MGFTYMFCLDESSIANHIGERKLRVTEGLIEGEPELEPKTTQQKEKEESHIIKDEPLPEEGNIL